MTGHTIARLVTAIGVGLWAALLTGVVIALVQVMPAVMLDGVVVAFGVGMAFAAWRVLV